MTIRLFISALAWAMWLLSANTYAAPQVVASIKPVHSLVASVMAGVGEPSLIIDGAASPHRYRLKPSQARSLAQADLVFWIGPQLETFLRKPIAQLAKNATSVALLENSSIKLLKIREDREHEHGHEHEHERGKDDKHYEESDTDPHIWLDPNNAILMVRAITKALSTVDSTNTSRYEKNAANLTDRLTELANQTETATSTVKNRPFLVFHDSYQYFEARYGLRSLGAILDRPDVPASAKRIGEVRKLMNTQTVSTCVFTEPQFNEGLAVAVASAGKSSIKTLDPLGASIPAGPDHYFSTIVALRDTLIQCLKIAR